MERVTAGPDDRPDLFVSYTAANHAWAEWIAWQVEEENYTTLIQAWDFRAGSDFVVHIRDATSRCHRTIAVLSANYLRSEFALAEWGAAFAADPSGRQGKLVPVRVGNLTVGGLDRSRVWIDLVGLDEDEARRVLLAGLAEVRAKPSSAPRFPRPGPDAAAPRFPLALPPVWNVPHHPNPNFTGRDTLLEDLERPGTGQRVVLSQAITGLGGVGKTAVAAEYAYRHRGDFDVVWWVRADKAVTMAQDMADLATAIGISADADLDAAVEAVRAWLEGNDRWLLVFDNAEDPAAVAARAPRGGGGKVLITSRLPHWSALATVLVVDVLDEAGAASFLVRRSGDGDDAAAVGLARELGRLPLALEQAGAYVAETPGVTLVAYRSMFAARAHELVGRAGPWATRAPSPPPGTSPSRP